MPRGDYDGATGAQMDALVKLADRPGGAGKPTQFNSVLMATWRACHRFGYVRANHSIIEYDTLMHITPSGLEIANDRRERQQGIVRCVHGVEVSDEVFCPRCVDKAPPLHVNYKFPSGEIKTGQAFVVKKVTTVNSKMVEVELELVKEKL